MAAATGVGDTRDCRRALYDATGAEVEYVMQFAEGEGFHHLHVHLIARTPEWNPDWKGPAVWGAFGTDTPVEAAAVDGGDMTDIGRRLGVVTTPVTL